MFKILLKKLHAQYTKNVCGKFWFKEFPRRRSVGVGSDVLDSLSLSLSLSLIIILETPWVESIQYVHFTFTIKHEQHANPTSLSLHGCCNVQTALYPTNFPVRLRCIECLTAARCDVIQQYQGSPKNTELFFLIYCCTYNLIRLVSFKVLPSTVDTRLPAFFPVLERVLERILRDGAKVL